MRSDPRPAVDFDQAASERVSDHDAVRHRLWVSAIRHLDAALEIFDLLGASGLHSASHIESARVHAKRTLRAARTGAASTTLRITARNDANRPADASSTQ